MKVKFLFSALFVFILLLTACQPGSGGTTTQEAETVPPDAELTQEQILSIGVVSDDPAGTIEGFQPLMDYLVKQLADPAVVKGRVIVTPDLDTMVEKLKSGEVDLFYESPYGALYTYENAGAVPMLVGWRKGVGEYHSVILASKDSGITTLDGLVGKQIAFADAGSTTGYFLPKAFLINAGYTLVEQSEGATIPENAIGYYFAGSADNMISAILLGKTVGGAEEFAVYDGLAQEDKDKLTILAQTDDVPRSLLMASATMSADLRERLVGVLKSAADTDEGKEALSGAKKTAKFDDMPLGAEGTMNMLQEMFAPVK